MNYFWLTLFILGIFNGTYSDDLQHVDEDNKETLALAVNLVEENETVSGVSVTNPRLSAEALSELQDFAKNISHSKGIYRETEKESDNERELRRSILKKATVATESDTMKTILRRFDYDKNKLQLLEQMEFIVHEYDVAVNFATLGGIKIIMPFLFSSDDEIVSCVASVLGAAMQSNPTVQKLAMNEDVGKNLLKLLVHKSPGVLSRIIFALSTFLRNAPEAQEDFIHANGVSKLSDILESHNIATNTKLKIITLFNDLAVEQETAEFYPSDRSSEKMAVLKRSFANELQKWGICKRIPSFLNLEDFDTHQKVTSAMVSLHSACHKDFKSDATKFRLKKLLKIYDPDSAEEDPLYPAIDKDLKRALYNELSDLIKKMKEENSTKYTGPMLRVEL